MSDPTTGRRIGFIGCGAMARALAGGLVAAGTPPGNILGSDPFPEQCDGFQTAVGATTTADNSELVSASDVVVLAVKPGAVPGLLRDLEPVCDPTDLARPLWVSIAAGVPIEALAAGLPPTARIVRSMPNTPALVGAGATALCANAQASEQDLALAESLFQAVGTTWRAPEEHLLDAVTGLSGSGPAYVFLFLEALGNAGVEVGLPREAACQLALQTVYGAAKLALEQGQSPAQLREQVSSPGGTTIEGLKELEAAGFRRAVARAVAAATDRSRELSNT